MGQPDTNSSQNTDGKKAVSQQRIRETGLTMGAPTGIKKPAQLGPASKSFGMQTG